MRERALEFARKAHGEQKRKYTGEPYIEHCIAVAKLVENVGGSEEMITAALLHDTVEDTETTLDDIGREFDGVVRSMVFFLTDDGVGNRAARKRAYREKLAVASGQTQTIKLADLIDNTKTIVEHDPRFAKVYMAEKRDLLEVLNYGDPTLYAEASRMVENYFRGQP